MPKPVRFNSVLGARRSSSFTPAASSGSGLGGDRQGALAVKFLDGLNRPTTSPLFADVPDDCEPTTAAKPEVALPPVIVPEIVGLEDGVEAPGEILQLDQLGEEENMDAGTSVESAPPNLHPPIIRYGIKHGHVEKLENVKPPEVVPTSPTTSTMTSVTPVNKYLSNDWMQQSYMMNDTWRREVVNITAVDPDNASNVQGSVDYALPYGMQQFHAFSPLAGGRFW